MNCSTLAFTLFYLAAQQGFALAQTKLGLMFMKGKGVPKDFRQAKHWLELAAEQGTAEAQTALGWLYLVGIGVAKDHDKALGSGPIKGIPKAGLA